MQEDKELFYEQLNHTMEAAPYKHKLFVLGDFNARVGRDYKVWSKVIGRHGIGARMQTAQCCLISV